MWSCITCKIPVMDNNMVPTLFHEVYKKRFGASHDSTQESTWCWLKNQNIQYFSSPAYTRDDPLHACITIHEGHWPKMLLWMLEEYMYILGWLCKDDRDGLMVLGHELLLLVCSRCCRKRGGAEHHTALPCCPSSIYQLAQETPWSMPCMHPRTPYPWNAWHGWYMIISWHLESHHLSPAMRVMARCYSTY